MYYRNTKQRTKMLKLLQSTTSHPTAIWLYDKIREDFPSISLGTIYRNLGVLEEQGLVQKLTCGSTFDRYDANVEPHIHYMCKECGEVTDVIDREVALELKKVVSKITNQVNMYSLICYGICDKCKYIKDGVSY